MSRAITGVVAAPWVLDLSRAQQGPATTLTLVQELDPDMVGSVGPGWEYYLDRPVPAETGEDPESLLWDDHYPSMQAGHQAAA